jgi:hypothetical protein
MYLHLHISVGEYLYYTTVEFEVHFYIYIAHLKGSMIGTVHEFSLQQGNASRDAKFIGGER